MRAKIDKADRRFRQKLWVLVKSAGDRFYVVQTEKEAKKDTQMRINRQRASTQRKSAPMSLEDIFSKITRKI